ncbi:hypothetical protein [Catellatospora methionotrophica]|uniref:hypothetical protein n=1 Tax=Catellatospora methionotrophica TaxID=121620 RepID=UPI00340EB9C5
MIEPSPQPRPPAVATAERPWWTLSGPGLSAVVAVCQLAMLLGPLHSSLQRDLGVSAAALAAITVVPLAAALLGGGLGYLLGWRAPTSAVVAGLLSMLVGAVVTALSPTSAMVLAAGAVTGLGAGAVLGTAAALTGRVDGHRATARLVLGLAALGGLAAGVVLGWVLPTMLSWRLAYLSMVVLILVALVATAVSGVLASARDPR